MKYRIVQESKDKYRIERLQTVPVRNWWGKQVGTKEEWVYIDWWFTQRCCERAIAEGKYDHYEEKVVKEVER